jgi:glucose-1-phosphate thymidylyltransferase
LESIAQAGIKEVGIVVGDTHAEIRKAVGDGSKFGLKVTYIQQEAPLGLAHAVKISYDFLKDSNFVMYLGDNLLKENLSSFVQDFNKAKPDAQILVTPVPNPQSFGVVVLNKDGKAVKLMEKPKDPPSNLALVGVYMFTPVIFEAVNAIKPSPRGELEITDAIQYLVDTGRTVLPHKVEGWWKDTGKLEDLLEANHLILINIQPSSAGTVDANSRIESNVVIEKGARIENSVVRGPAIIGERSVVRNSFVGPFTSIYHDVVVENSEIQNSIVLEHSKLLNIRPVEGSLIGQHAEVVQTNSKPMAYRIVVGDSSRLEIPK